VAGAGWKAGGIVNRVRVGEQVLPDDPAALAEFEALVAFLKQSHGFDFSVYKRSSLMRRVLVRMQTIGARGFAAYLDSLQVDPGEFTRLFDTILINVTSFFRDPAPWDYLRDQMIPRLLAAPAGGSGLRVWSAGCASGEEAYSIAMLLAEAMGLEAFRERVRIYATDVDEEALRQARAGVYGGRVAEHVPAPLLAKYFDRRGDGYTVGRALRRSVIFGRHDLIQDAPISRVDLLICRNCLMYFTTEAQARILRRFHFALLPQGVLFLGKAETLLAQSPMFEAADLKRRIFVKAEPHLALRPLTLTPTNGDSTRQDLRDRSGNIRPALRQGRPA
jgi:two-component system CheB/CheR fusion protein